MTGSSASEPGRGRGRVSHPQSVGSLLQSAGRDERNRLEIGYEEPNGTNHWEQLVVHGPTGRIGIGVGDPGAEKHEIDQQRPMLIVNGYASFDRDLSYDEYDMPHGRLRLGLDGYNDILSDGQAGTDVRPLPVTSRRRKTDFKTGGSREENIRLRITSNGRVGIGTTEPEAELHVNGNIIAQDVGLRNADVAEEFTISEPVAVEPGSVMVIDEGTVLRQCTEAYDTKVAGVVSGAGDYKPALVVDRQTNQTGRLPIALMGKVFCRVDASQMPIKVGDCRRLRQQRATR